MKSTKLINSLESLIKDSAKGLPEKIFLFTSRITPIRKSHGHFISLLYECRLATASNKDFQYKQRQIKSGQWPWHKRCQANLICVHRIFRKFI